MPSESDNFTPDGFNYFLAKASREMNPTTFDEECTVSRGVLTALIWAVEKSAQRLDDLEKKTRTVGVKIG